MVQVRFLNSGKLVGETLVTKAVGLKFNEASKTLKAGQTKKLKLLNTDEEP